MLCIVIVIFPFCCPCFMHNLQLSISLTTQRCLDIQSKVLRHIIWITYMSFCRQNKNEALVCEYFKDSWIFKAQTLCFNQRLSLMNIWKILWYSKHRLWVQTICCLQLMPSWIYKALTFWWKIGCPLGYTKHWLSVQNITYLLLIVLLDIQNIDYLHKT